MQRLALAAWMLGLPAQAYVLNFNDSSQPRHWELLTPQFFVSTNVVNTNTHAIRYYLASDAFSTTNTVAELNAVRAAIGQWMAVTNKYFNFEEAGLVNPPVDVNDSDHSNIIYWVKGTTMVNGGHDNIAGALGVTFATWDVDTHAIIEADIVFNGHVNSQGQSNIWFTDFNDTASTNVFVEGVALHELGHFLGLGHSPVGGATMLFRGSPGINAQAGLAEDDIAGGRMLYATSRAAFGAVKGTVNKNGSPVLGAAVYFENSASNVVAGTVTLPNGSYEANMLPPGTYKVRVTPLDPFANPRLCAGYDIGHSANYANNNFTGADTSFLPTTNTSVVVSAHATNNLNLDVTAGVPTFRIAYVRKPTTNPGAFSINSMPVLLTAGQSNYFVSVFSSSLPTNGATFSITGDGLTLGNPTYEPGTVFGGLNGISMSISVASNATPGLRTLMVAKGADAAYASGFFEVTPAVPDCNFDGLDDRFQRQYFAPWTTGQAAPGNDPDGDLMNNMAEYIAGTNPTNAASALRIRSVARTNSTATVSWDSVSGKNYQVLYRQNVASGYWSNAGAVVTATGTTSFLTDSSATNSPRIYRVQVLP